MQIDISPAAEQRLADQAAAHGFSSVDEFVEELLYKVASLSDEAVVFAALDDKQIARSEEIIRQGEEDLAAGRFQDAREGLIKLGAVRGLSFGE